MYLAVKSGEHIGISPLTNKQVQPMIELSDIIC